jgi:ribosomal-protein-alanine N-acetyltransferase
MATLEVRPSNQAAIQLYEKFGFGVVSRRKNYYQDNREDALLMKLEPLELAWSAAGGSEW